MIKKNKIKNLFIRSVVFLSIIFFFFQIVMVMVFLDDLKMMIIPDIFLIVIIGILIYYYGCKMIYKVKKEESKIIFYACLKKYIIDENLEIRKNLKGYYISKGRTRILLHSYIGMPLERNRCWTDNDIAEIKRIYKNDVL